MGQLYRTLTTAALLFLFFGCGEQKEMFRTTDENGQGRKAPLSYYEATLRPSDFDEEVDIIQKAHAQSTGTTPLTIPTDSTTVVEEEVQGFRIQIFASSSIDDATAAKSVAEGKPLRDSVYVVYDPPVYKVRVGDYATRLEANQQLVRLVNIGYPDAWVVADRILLRKTVRVAKDN